MERGTPPRRPAAPPQPLRWPLEAQERILLAAAVADLREELYRQRRVLEAVVQVLALHGLWPEADAHPVAEWQVATEPAPSAPGSGARAVAGGGSSAAAAVQGGTAHQRGPARPGRPAARGPQAPARGPQPPARGRPTSSS